MSLDKSEIKNFDLLCQLLKDWDKEPDDPFIINEMLNTEGYTEWLDWMEKHEPQKLP